MAPVAALAFTLAHVASALSAQAPLVPVLAPCTEIRVGPCIQLPTPAIERVANGAIAFNGIAHFYDVTSTMLGIGAGRLIERNPFLRQFVDDPLWMALAKGGIALGQTYVFLRLKKRYPVWVIVIAGVSGAATTWAASHNRRELRR
jgi:hypothetical protein